MWHYNGAPVIVRNAQSIFLTLTRETRCMHGLAKRLAHTRSSHIAGQRALLAETALPFRLLEVFQYGTNLCEPGTHPFPQGLLIL